MGNQNNTSAPNNNNNNHNSWLVGQPTNADPAPQPPQSPSTATSTAAAATAAAVVTNTPAKTNQMFHHRLTSSPKRQRHKSESHVTNTKAAIVDAENPLAGGQDEESSCNESVNYQNSRNASPSSFGHFIPLDQSSINETSFDAGLRMGDANNGNTSIISQTSQPTVPVVFRYDPKHLSVKVKEVFLIGSFTDWLDKIPMVKSDCDFLAILELPEGEHQYKFIADGRWECSHNDMTVESVSLVERLHQAVHDGFNGQNNVVTVRKSDFDVMSALKADAEMTHLKTRSRLHHRSVSARYSPANEQDMAGDDVTGNADSYSNEIPPKAFTNVLDRPPMLPPHLTNIILNKDTATHCEPTLLPEPNHVMLRHLYALSIRDGVLVLSTTTRFREKYVTTCFYKPIVPTTTAD